MIGGLIQHENVRIGVGDHGERHTRLLSSAERLHGPVRHVCASIIHSTSTFSDTEACQLAAQLRDFRAGVVVLHDLEGRLGEVQLIEMMLGEHGAAKLVVASDATLQRDQIAEQKLFLTRQKRRNLDQGGFTDSVGTQDTNARLEVDAEVDISEENTVLRVTKSDPAAGIEPEGDVDGLENGQLKRRGLHVNTRQHADVDKLEAKHRVFADHRNGVHFLLQLFHHLQLALHLPVHKTIRRRKTGRDSRSRGIG